MAEEIFITSASEVASKATSDIYDLLKRQLSYLFKYQSYIKDLENQVCELRKKREMVQKPVESAERQGEGIYELVTTWLSDVKEFTEEVAKPITEDKDKANKGGCFKLGSFPNLIQRYRLGKKAMKATMEGAKLLGKGNFSSFSYRPALQRTESMYVRDYEAFDSRKQALQEIMEALQDVNVSMIGVYGMGGVGKTTLVKKLAWQVKKNKLFDEVAIAEVTQTPDYKKIQEQIAFDLGLEFRHEGEYTRAGLLRNKIKKEKNVLVKLDGIWTKLDLDAIGIPLGGAEKERKDEKTRPCTILITARNQDLLSKDMKTQKNIYVRPLSDGDSWNLFRKIVGDSAESSDFHPVAVEIVRKSAGLPLAISTIANALKNEGLHAWEYALAQLKRCNPRRILEIGETLYSTIELSYNFLKNEEAKSLFLLCTLKDAGTSVSISYLLKWSMGWNLFGDVYTVEEGRNRLHMLIDLLKGSCLLLDGDGDDNVKMHDIIHAVAVSIASTDKFMFNIHNVNGLKEVLEEKISKDATAISLPYRDINDELPERLDYPKLKLFFLFMRNRSLHIPDPFFEEMKELRVLDLTNISLLSLPSSLSRLKNLQTLCLDSCLLGDIRILGELRKLEILSMLDSDIEQLPEEIRQLTRLKLLDLSNCLNLKYIAPNVISSLSQLEELYMGNSFVQWEVEGVDNQGRRNASLEELKQLSNLTALHLHIQDARSMPQDLFFKKLKSYKIFIGDKWKWSGKYDLSTSRTFKLKINDRTYLRPEVKSLLKMSEDLSLEEMNGVRNVLYELDVYGFPHLKHLLVKDGLQLIYIINSVARKLAFPKLESLILRNLINLKKIFHGQLNAGSCSKLRILKIEKCDRLEYLFPSFLAENLSQLQEIEVTDCKNLKEIFREESKDHGDEIKMNNMIDFTQLCSLTLQRLPQFVKISSDMKVVFPRLKNLKLCSINIENTWLGQPMIMSFYSRCLQSLTVEECNGLKFLFSSSNGKSLRQLEKLVINHCKSMEVIIDAKGVEGEEKIIDMSFPKLLYMKLAVLPELTSFGTGNSIEFPSLKGLHIESCSNLKTFFCKSFYPNMVREEPEEEVNLENCFIVRNPLFDERVAFPSLENMILSRLDNLQTIWHHQLHEDSFSKLQTVRVKHCKKILAIIPSNALGRFSTLKNLRISDCASLEEVFEFQGLSIVKEDSTSKILFPKLKHLKLKNLPRLTRFCNFSGSFIELSSLSILSIDSCPVMKTFISNFVCAEDMKSRMKPKEINSNENLHMQIQPLFDKKVKLPNLEALVIKQIDELEKIWDDQLSLDSFCKLNFLGVISCNKLVNIFPSNMLGIIEILGMLVVVSCDSVEEIFEVQEKSSSSVEDILAKEEAGSSYIQIKLEVLHLMMLPNLKKLYPAPQLLEFPLLKTLWVHGCDKVEILASQFSSHQETHEEHEQDISNQQSLLLVDKDAFPSLEELELIQMPRLLQLWRGNSQPSTAFQNLKTLKVVGCDSLDNSWLSSVSFQNLVNLEVLKCDGLRYILTLSKAKTLDRLQRMHICHCKMMEEIITHLGDEVLQDSIVFNKLDCLELHYLSNLKSFCRGDYTLEFPSLNKVIVRQCLKMETFCQGVLSTPKLQKLLLIGEDEVKECWEGNLNSTIQHLFKIMNAQGSKED